MGTKLRPARSKTRESGRCSFATKMPPHQPICQCDVPILAYVLFASGGFCILDLL